MSSDPTKGGKGKKAPYETQHYRIPVPIRPVVEQLANAYKRLVANGTDTENLLNGTWRAITEGYYPGDKKDHLQERVTELDNANWEMQKQLTTIDEIAQKRQRQITELEAENQRLREALATKQTEVELFKNCTTAKPDIGKLKTYKLHGREVVRLDELKQIL
jgi:hypothetical protein